MKGFEASYGVTIRRASKGDAVTLAALGLQVFLDTYAVEGMRRALAEFALADFSPENMRKTLDRKDVVLFVAERGVHLLGFCQLGFDVRSPFVDAPRQVEIERLYVQERFCGQGLGALLMAEAEREVWERGYDAFWLSVWVHNERAIRFYEKNNFVDVGKFDFSIEKERHENRVLARALPD